jgi:hypothetical protein
MKPSYIKSIDGFAWGPVGGQAIFGGRFAPSARCKSSQPEFWETGQCLRRDMEKYVTISYLSSWSMV